MSTAPNPDTIPGGDPNATPGGPATPKEGDKVDHSTYVKTVDQLKAAQLKAKEAEDKLLAFESKERQAAEAKLKEDGKLKELLDAKEKDLADEKAAKQKLEMRVANSVKLQAFFGKLGGKLKDKSYAMHIDTDSIKVTGDLDVDEASLDAEVKRFTEAHKDLVDFGKTGNPPPADAGKGTPNAGAITYAKWLELSTADKKLRWKDVIDKN